MFKDIDINTLLKLLAGQGLNSANKLAMQNAEYIQQLNANIVALDKNIQTINNSIKELARDTAALQRAVIEYLKEKEIIKTEEDVRLLQKLHMRHIAFLDQATAHGREDVSSD